MSLALSATLVERDVLVFELLPFPPVFLLGPSLRADPSPSSLVERDVLVFELLPVPPPVFLLGLSLRDEPSPFSVSPDVAVADVRCALRELGFELREDVFFLGELLSGRPPPLLDFLGSVASSLLEHKSSVVVAGRAGMLAS